tara:strand:- start:704 stop:973 length:270 start_codon:yes stop_codon:yes gene_type:complete
MVDNAVSADKIVKVVRHELSHACNPGQKHNDVWKEFDRLIGGDRQRCCTDEEVHAHVHVHVQALQVQVQGVPRVKGGNMSSLIFRCFAH